MDLKVYTDGSYSESRPGVTQGGVLIVTEDNKPQIAQFCSTDVESFVKTRNDGGELLAAMNGISLALHILNSIDPSRGQKHIIYVYHDYAGVKKYLEGPEKWKATKPASALYVDKITALKKANLNVEIKFVKVRAHTGIKGNEIVDKIAKGLTPPEVESIMIKPCIIKSGGK